MFTPLRRRSVVAESTPKSTNKRSRVSVLQDEAKTISPLRRQSRVQDVHEVQIEVYNDEVEKTLRREEANQQEKLTSALDSSLSTSVNEEDLKNHFDICVKLFMENKINSKNAWNLKFIDYMRMATTSFKDPLQIGSTSLDVSSKVYGIRVDDTHSYGLKLATNIAKTTNKGAEDDDVEEDAGDNNEIVTDQHSKKKKKRVMGKKATITTDPNTLFAPLTKLEPMFFQTRQNIELSLIENLCTNRLSMDNSCYKFMLLSNEKVWLPASREEDVVNSIKVSINISPLGNEKICAPFSNFDISQLDLQQEKFNQSLPNNPVLDDLNNVALPMLELDGSVHDDSDVAIEEDGNDDQAIEIEPEPPRIIVSDFPKDTCEHIASLPCEKFIENIWAGPSHWKLKCIKSAKTRFSGQQNKLNKHTTKRGPKRQQEYIDMNCSVDVDMNVTITVKRKAKFVDKSEIAIPLIDPDIRNVKNTILESTFKPGAKFYMEEQAVVNLDDRVEPYNYDNPSDNNYCSQNTNEDLDHSGEHHDSGVNADSDIHEENAMRNENYVDNLIEAPEMVPKTYIPYALQAKKIDIKTLKSIIWDCLTKNSSVQNKIVPTTLVQLWKVLPSHLNEKMRQDLTPHLAFTALLHLANEHNLKLNGVEELNNLYISDS